MAKAKKVEELGFTFTPKGKSQQLAAEVYRESRVLFLLGPAGTGKTGCALGLALNHILRTERMKLWLTRPQVTCDENCGFLPGDLKQKLLPWLGPFYDVFSSFSDSPWEQLEKSLSERLEIVPLGFMRGRTVRQAVLVADELQNATEPQLKCLMTRIGQGGKLVLCGDYDQSDKFTAKNSPLAKVAEKMKGVEGITIIRFDAEDQLRDPLVTKILAAW